MADLKLTALTELTSLSGDELLYVVEDADGTPVSRKITPANLLAAVTASLTALATADTTLDDKIDVLTALPVDTETGAFTIQADQAKKVIEASNASGFNCTVPTPASLGWDVGEWCEVYQEGAGQITFVASGSTTIRARGGANKIAGQYGGARLRVKSTSGNGVWALEGDIVT